MFLAVIGCFIGSFAGVLLGDLVWEELSGRVGELRLDDSDVPELRGFLKDFSEWRRRNGEGADDIRSRK